MLPLRKHIAAAVVAFIGISSAAGAQAQHFVATLTTSQEPPGTVNLTNPARSPFGTATFVLNDARTQLLMVVSVTGIDFTGSQTPATGDNLMAAHIHAHPFPPQSPLPATAGVRWGFFGTPFNDNNPTNVVCTPLAVGVGGSCTGFWDAPEGQNTTLTEQLPALLNNLAYVNFHTVENPTGEIRGQISAVPEPASVVLFGSGLVGLAGVAWRRRRQS